MWIGTDTADAARNRGPRMVRTSRTTVGYDPAKPSARILLCTDTANSRGCAVNNAATRAFQRASITFAASGTIRRPGGPPCFNHFAIVAG